MTPFYQDEAVTLYCGDCREVLPHADADVLFTDPDYGVGMDYGRKPLKAAEADALLVDVLRAARISSGHGLMFWSGSWNRIRAVPRISRRSGWRVKHLGIWHKQNGSGPTGNGLARRFETWFWLDRGIGKKHGEWDFLGDCLAENRVTAAMREAVAHPSQKPESLIEKLVRFFSAEGDTLLEPFAGSGTALVVAKRLNRKAIGCELNEAYCEKIARRLETEQPRLAFAASQEVLPLTA
jgi:site-specific DNA-methyltransferase (adenine-specific)